MSNKNFDLKILDLYWIDKDINNKADLCAHGRVFVKIGDEVVSDKNSLDISLSTAALYLMRTIKNDYKKGDYPSQLLPCCGNFMVADPKTSSVSIYGCPNGIDWAITHVGDKVKHVSEGGQEALVDKDVYKKIVLDFADQVEDFYKKSLPRTMPKNNLDKEGYLMFWEEWRSLRDA